MGDRVGMNFINSLYPENYVICSVLGQLFHISPTISSGDYYQGNLEQLLNFLMQHDPNHVSGEEMASHVVWSTSHFSRFHSQHAAPSPYKDGTR